MSRIWPTIEFHLNFMHSPNEEKYINVMGDRLAEREKKLMFALKALRQCVRDIQ